ncbi:MAG: RNA polymerase II-associated protein [Thermodesulfobacteriota bacterium]|nr:RNA polymerase II-associated protein [Thermodesulfobacteriota bacterium]
MFEVINVTFLPLTEIRFIELECAKHHEKMNSEQAECRHPGEYCKYRHHAIHLTGRENRRDGADAPVQDNNKDKDKMKE